MRGRFGTVAQKLIKLFFDVALATWLAAGVCWPSFSKPVCTREESRQRESCKSVEVEVDEDAAEVAVAVLDFEFAEEDTASVAFAEEEVEALLLDSEDEESSPDPEPVAPVAAIRESTSDCVVHVILVPALFTRGSAAHLHVLRRISVR